jgi:DNA polymerase I-like protein with 3'-5' exonuclease and polymerase domains
VTQTYESGMELFGGIHYSDYPDPDNITRLDLAALPMIADFHKYGIRLDVPFLNNLNSRIETIQKEIELETEIYIGSYQYRTSKGAMIPFSIGSRDHLAQLLFEEWKIQGDDPVPLTPKGKRFEVSEEIMEPFKDRHPAVPGIIEWHKSEKLRNTYTSVLPLQADSDSRIHTQFNATVASTGRLSSSNPNCFDKDTEVLTPSGWKKIAELREYFPEEQVAQWENGAISFVKPTGYISSRSDELVKIKNTHIDLYVTSNHRCLLRNRKTGELKVFDALNYPSDWEQIHAGKYSGTGSSLTQDEIDFMVVVQADGSWVGKKPRLDFSFKKPRKIVRFNRLLKRLGLPQRLTGKERKRCYIPECQLTRKMFALLGEKKLFPWHELFKMDAVQLRLFTNEIFFWDGGWTRKNNYASKEKHNAELVATAFSLSFRRTRVRKYVNSSGSISWQADVTNRDYSLTTNCKKSLSDASSPFQDVYCVSVPSSYLLIRRNNCIMVTGNCQNIPIRTKLGKEIRNAFIASPGWGLVSADYSQIEMVWAAHRSQDPTMLDIFRRGQDLHDRTACSVFGLDYEEIQALKKLVADKVATEAQISEFNDFKQFQRLPCKTVGFGVLYGQTAEGLQASLASEGIFWTLERCEEFITHKFFAVYALLKAMLDRDYAYATRYGLICDEFGRVRLVPEAKSQIKRIRNEGLRKAGNHPEQSSAQGSIKIAMARLNPICRKIGPDTVRPLLQIHDQLIMEARKHFLEEFAQIMRQEMEAATPLTIPVRSSSDIGERWGDL